MIRKTPKDANDREKVLILNANDKVSILLRDIITLQAALTRPLSSRDLLARACKFFQPRHYFDVIEERLVGSKLCGYPPCSESLLDSPPLTSKEVSEQAKREKEYAKSIRRGGRGQRTRDYRENNIAEGERDDDDENDEVDESGVLRRDDDIRITERARLPDAERIQSYCSRRCFTASLSVLRQLSEVQPQARLFDGQTYDLTVFPLPSTSELKNNPVDTSDVVSSTSSEILGKGFESQREVLRIQLGLVTGGEKRVGQGITNVMLSDSATIVERNTAIAPLPPLQLSENSDLNSSTVFNSKSSTSSLSLSSSSSSTINVSGGEEFVDLRAIRDAKRAEKASKRLKGGKEGSFSQPVVTISDKEKSKGTVVPLDTSNREMTHAATALVAAIQKVAEVYAAEESKSSSAAQQLVTDQYTDDDGFGLEDLREDLSQMFLAPTSQVSNSLSKPISQKSVRFSNQLESNDTLEATQIPLETRKVNVSKGISVDKDMTNYNNDDEDEDNEEDYFSEYDDDEEEELCGGMWLNTPLDITGSALLDDDTTDNTVKISTSLTQRESTTNSANGNKSQMSAPLELGAIGFGHIEATAAFFAPPDDIENKNESTNNSLEEKQYETLSNEANGESKSFQESVVSQSEPLKTTSSVIESVSQFRAFGVSSFGLLFSAISRWRSANSPTALSTSASLVVSQSKDVCQESQSLTIARKELIISHLHRAIGQLAENDSSSSSSFVPFARSSVSNSRISRLVESFDLHSPVPLLTEREWQFMSLAILEAIRMADEYGDLVVDDHAPFIFAASKTSSIVLLRGFSLVSISHRETKKPSSTDKKVDTDSPTADQIARLACMFLFGLDIDLDGITTESKLSSAKSDTITPKADLLKQQSTIHPMTKRNSKATLAQVELELAMLKNVMR
jgi:hypothetical protein